MCRCCSTWLRQAKSCNVKCLFGKWTRHFRDMICLVLHRKEGRRTVLGGGSRDPQEKGLGVGFLQLPFSCSLLEGRHVNSRDRT